MNNLKENYFYSIFYEKCTFSYFCLFSNKETLKNEQMENKQRNTYISIERINFNWEI